MTGSARILVVDDDPDIRQVLGLLLEDRGHRVLYAADGPEAILTVRDCGSLDLIILDIMMPGVDGVEACRAIREFCNAPILFLTARTTPAAMVSAYSSGGDDFLGKPFSQAELLLKVDSLLRRYRVYKGKKVDETDLGFELDLEQRRVLRGSEVVETTAKEFDILEFFMSRRGTVVSVKEVYESVWHEKYLPTSSNTVMVHILNLRKKLEEDPAAPRLIRTVWGKGYQFG